jgi:hypothetical protein
MAQVEMMCANLTATNYELVLGKLDQVRELHALVTGEEKNYTQAEEYVDSVREETLFSQGVLSKWQSTLLSHAYERAVPAGETLLMLRKLAETGLQMRLEVYESLRAAIEEPG